MLRYTKKLKVNTEENLVQNSSLIITTLFSTVYYSYVTQCEHIYAIKQDSSGISALVWYSFQHFHSLPSRPISDFEKDLIR